MQSPRIGCTAETLRGLSDIFPQRGPFPDLPLADVLHPLTKGPLQASAQLQGVAADLDDVVDKSAHGRQRERRGEEHHISKLDEHLLIVLKRVL